MSKLVSEADKLLEKGKIPEALEKLKAALKAEPLNQLVVTKLANVYLEAGESDKAVAVFAALADRLSEAGKSQVAIAIYKQAMDIDPSNVNLKVKFTIECEAAGKLSDAQSQGQIALKHFLARKKYFDAANLMPVLVRTLPKDDGLKATWIDILQFAQADQKLIHLLVALCGPPGLVSEEFSVGGEPTQLSPALYDSLKRLVFYFPRDPRIAYAVAWSGLRRGVMRDFYLFLAECLRRDPDFCLGLLLFARTLAEQQKLNESLFVYKHLRERIMADKSVDMVTLNRLIDGFVEKNGWINFSDGEVLDASGFLKSIKGAGSAEAAPAAKEEKAAVPPPPPSVSPPPLPSPGNSPLAQNLAPESAPEPASESSSLSSLDLFPPTTTVAPAQQPKAEVPPQEPAMEAGGKATPSQGEIVLGGADSGEMEVEHTSATRIFVSAKAKNTKAPAEPVATSPKEPEETPPAPAERNSGRILFNPFEESSAPRFVEDGQPAAPAMDAGEKTEMFSPMDLLGAADRMQAKNAEAETKAILERPEDLAEVQNPRGDLPVFSAASNDASSPEKSEEPPEPVGGPTQLYSPMEAVEAGVESRRPLGVNASQSAVESLDLAPSSGDNENPEGAISIVPTGLPAQQESPASEEVHPEQPPAFSGGAFVPIPEAIADSAEKAQEAPSDSPGAIDMGDDLLADPTRILVRPVSPTQHLVKELEETIDHRKKAIDPDLLLKKSERFIAKRNYYMARKILRHAQAVGADAIKVKERLREIRKLELPEGLYNTVSSDDGVKEKSSEILDRLEKEFDLKLEESGEEAREFGDEIESQLENIFRETDPRTILDFGVALHEMGLFRQAESVFSRMVDEYPETYFDAYYLAAISKYARKDYAGAVSILKKLSSDGGKAESEKIQIYYVLGELFEKMERPDSSKEFFRKVAELDANYRNIRHKLED